VLEFIFVIIEIFFYLLPLRHYKRKSVEVGVSWRGVTFSTDFRGKSASPTNRSWCQSSSDCPFVWYQNFCCAPFRFVTIHAHDRRTDGQTDRWTDGRNYDSQDRPCICSHDKHCLYCYVWSLV